jgi:hypothetical protein
VRHGKMPGGSQSEAKGPIPSEKRVS